tara:strand:+ start:488 stop:997 length:510 start_codon:yes stop_codon:yes gene_type:complete
LTDINKKLFGGSYITPADVRVHYCKSKKSIGTPIIVNPKDSQEYDTDNFQMNNVDVRVKFNNAVSKEKSSGATSILEVWKHKHKPIEDNPTLDYRPRKNKNKSAYNECISCGHEFDSGEIKHKWKLRLGSSNKFHNGSFLTEQCSKCALDTCDLWIDSLMTLRENVKNE